MSIQEAKNLLQYAMQNDGTGDCLKNAEELLLHDAEQGNTEAMCLLGDIYYWMADEEMYQEAFTWYQRATHSGDTGALAKIGWCYCKGHGTEKDIVRGFRCLEQAVTRGSVTAMVRLGVLYLTGCEVEKNPANAVKLFDMAEKRGSKAARWYRLAADQNLAEAQYRLAFCYENGYGVDKD